MQNIEARSQAQALTSLIDEADDDIQLNGTVSQDELAQELQEMDAKWQGDDRHAMRRT